jgi:hypothetical protein
MKWNAVCLLVSVWLSLLMLLLGMEAGNGMVKQFLILWNSSKWTNEGYKRGKKELILFHQIWPEFLYSLWQPRKINFIKQLLLCCNMTQFLHWEMSSFLFSLSFVLNYLMRIVIFSSVVP